MNSLIQNFTTVLRTGGICLSVAVALLISPHANAQQGVSGSKWSPDGKFITFSAIVDGNDDEIFIMRADGRGVRQLTKNDHTDLYPTFSNDGQTIYFSATQDRGEGQRRDWDIFKVSVNGGAVERIFGEPGMSEYHVVELPDGRIGFSRRPNGDPYDSDLFAWDPETEKTEYLVDEPPIRPRSGLFEIRIAAPLSGDRVLFSSRRNGHNEIFETNLDGTDIEQLTSVFQKSPDDWLGNGLPSVSADGRYFAVWTDQASAKPAMGDPDGYIVHKIYDRETGESRYLPKPDLHRFMVFPHLSPDGSKVAFGAAIAKSGPRGPWGIFVQDVASGEITELWRQPESE